MRRDLAHAEQLAAAAFELDGSQWVGDWHTHPAGGGTPSDTDLDGYASALAAVSGMDVFLTIIVTPSPFSGWEHPRLNAWIFGPSRLSPGLQRAALVSEWYGGR